MFTIIFWNKKIELLTLSNSNTKKKILQEFIKFNIKNEKYFKILNEEEEKEKEFLDNFEKIKHRLKEKDILQINDWSAYKKKNVNEKIIKTVKKIKKKPININTNWYKFIINNMKQISKNNFINLFNNKNINFLNINKIYDIFLKINLLKINKISKYDYFSNQKPIYMIVDLRTQKPVIVIKFFKKQFTTLTNGLTFKKLNLNHKKYKKSVKITFLTIKNTLIKMGFFKNFKSVFVYIKGLNSISHGVIEYINKNLKMSDFKGNLIIINNHKKSMNKSFKFKKIKAIKRRLKKKNIKSK